MDYGDAIDAIASIASTMFMVARVMGSCHDWITIRT